MGFSHRMCLPWGERGKTVLVVQVVGRADRDHVYVVAAHGFFYVAGGFNALKFLPRLRQPLLVGIAQHDQPHVRDLLVRAHVAAPHAKADYCYAKLFHCFSLLYRYGRLDVKLSAMRTQQSTAHARNPAAGKGEAHFKRGQDSLSSSAWLGRSRSFHTGVSSSQSTAGEFASGGQKQCGTHANGLTKEAADERAKRNQPHAEGIHDPAERKRACAPGRIAA